MPEPIRWDYPFPVPENQQRRLPQRRSPGVELLEDVGIVVDNAVGLLARFLNGCALVFAILMAAAVWGIVLGSVVAFTTWMLFGWEGNLTGWIIAMALAKIVWAGLYAMSEALGETLLTVGKGVLWYGGITGVLAVILRCNWLGLAFLGLPVLLLVALYVSIRNRPEPPVTRQRLPFDNGVDDPDFE